MTSATAAPKPETDDAVVQLIDRLERHRAAIEGASDLKIGPHSTINDYRDCIAILLHLRRTVRALEERVKELSESASRIAALERALKPFAHAKPHPHYGDWTNNVRVIQCTEGDLRLARFAAEGKL